MTETPFNPHGRDTAAAPGRSDVGPRNGMTPDGVLPAGASLETSGLRGALGGVRSGLAASAGDLAGAASASATAAGVSASATAGGASAGSFATSAAKDGVHKALGTGDLLKGNTSDGTMKGDTEQITKHAAQGANIGTKIGGPAGTVVGAAAGGALGAAKSKRGRWVIAGIVLAQPIAFIMALVLITSIFGAASSSFEATTRASASDAAISDGVEEAAVADYAEAADAAGIDWEVLAAIVNSQGDTTGAGEKSAADLRRLVRAANRGEPIGPYLIDVKAAMKTAAALDVPFPRVADLADREDSSEFIAALLSKLLHENAPDAPETGLSAGTVLSEADETRDAASEVLGTSYQVLVMSEDEDGQAEAEAIKEAYEAAIAELPIRDASDIAAEAYATALTWHLGGPIACVPAMGGTVVNGAWANPISGAINNVHETSDYNSGGHVGMDIDTPNTGPALPVYAAGSGTVIWAQHKTTSYGNHIKIDHGGGLMTIYAHLSQLDVAVNDTVTAGQQIGLEGTTGNSSGDHLHFELHQNGIPIDPAAFFAQRGVTIGAPGAPGAPGATAGTPTAPTTPATPGSVPVSTTPSDPNTVFDAVPQQFTATDLNGVQWTFKENQLNNAAAIIAEGEALGVSDDALIIALMTAMQESKLLMYASDKYPVTETLPHDAVGSDHDSVGLFQQRPVSGWGTPTELMDASYNARAFFGGPTGPNYPSPRGLLDIPGWESMSKTAAAQAVQVSAFPNAYAPWEPVAIEMVARLKGLSATAGCGGDEDGESVLEVGSTAAAGDAAAAIAFAMSQRGKPYSWGAVGPGSYDCSGLMLAAWKSVGVTLPRVSRDQAKFGQAVKPDLAAMTPGDMVFYGNPVYHVAMYIGNGQVVHAPYTGAVVRVERWDMEKVSGVRRVPTRAADHDEHATSH